MPGHAIVAVVIAVWVLAILCGGLADNPNRGVIQRMIDDARMRRQEDESNGR